MTLGAYTPADVETVAIALCAADGCDWHEQCGYELDEDGECDSGTCVAATFEDHDPAWAREHYRNRARAALSALPGVPARALPATTWQQQGDIEVLMMGEIPVGRLCHRGKPSWILNIASLSHSWTTEKTMEQARAALLTAFGDWCRKAGLA